MSFICINGEFVDAAQGALSVSNRGFLLGDGLFETIKVKDGCIQLASCHWERLWTGMQKLNISFKENLSTQQLESAILQLCEKNNCASLGRVRLTVFRENEPLSAMAQGAGYVIEAVPLDPLLESFNCNGLVIGYYLKFQKSCDFFSNLKSINRLPYVMANRYAKENQWDDCLILNTKGRIAESTIANVFLIMNNQILTPALSEGCVAGVMRRQIINTLKQKGIKVMEGEVSITDILNADELFLTNAIRGIKWVKMCNHKTYDNSEVKALLKYLN